MTTIRPDRNRQLSPFCENAVERACTTLSGRMARPTTKEKPRRGRPGMKGEVRRYSKLPREELDKIDYKNIALLQRFITERGKIRSRRVTGLSRRDQSKMARAVKRSRELGLLPYVDATKGLERTGGGRGRSRDRD